MKHKILVVEDEQDTADLLKRLLEREGFSVLHSKDGRQASTLIRTERPPSLLLLDLVIPYVSGSELLRLIRHHPDWKHTPVIVLSADSYEPDIQRALHAGATAYVTKQKGSAGLIQAVKRILSAKTGQDQSVPKGSGGTPRKPLVSPHRPPGKNHCCKKRAP